MNKDLLEQLKSFEFDESHFSNDASRHAFRFLLNAVEQFASEVQQLREENQKLKDEINRLKGEQGKPEIRPQKKDGDISSEKERKTPKKPRKKGSKKGNIQINRVEHCPVDRSVLPEDAVSKGVEINLVQDITIQTENIEFRREVFYSPSLGRRFIGSLPPGYEGTFGPGVKTLVQVLYHDAHVTQPGIFRLLRSCGVDISAATISRIITGAPELFQQEYKDIIKSGLKSADYQQIDDTGARVNGKNHYVHVLCNPFYTAYFTRPRKDRLTILEVVSPDGLKFHWTQEAIDLMEVLGLSQKQLTRVSEFKTHNVLSEQEVDERLKILFPNPGKGETNRHRIKEACAVVAYRNRSDAIKQLVCDDAPQFKNITEWLALCWVHEGRHYKKLKPFIHSHRKKLDIFLKDFWSYYRRLRDYKENPCPKRSETLSKEFDVLFSRKTGYEELDERITKTAAKKDNLLLMLDHPQIPLHNNESELGARNQARKRDVSLQTKNAKGTHAKDVMMTVVQTARKLGVNIFNYVHDRVTGTFNMTSLADLIPQKS